MLLNKASATTDKHATLCTGFTGKNKQIKTF